MFEVDGRNWDSQEEWEFWLWLKEAQEKGVVEDFLYQPGVFTLSPKQTMMVEKELKTKTKTVEKFLLHPHQYRPDFSVRATDRLLEFDHRLTRAYPLIEEGFNLYYVDVKGSWQGQYKSGREFAINQKWLMYQEGIFVNKVIPESWFRRVWLPERLRLTLRGGKPSASKKWKGCQTYVEILESTDNEVEEEGR